MPFSPSDHRKIRDSSNSSLSSTPAASATAVGPTAKSIAAEAGAAFARPKIYPREFSRQLHPKSPHLTGSGATASPLLNALPTPSDIFGRAPFPTFLSSSSPSSAAGAPNSLGSAPGGVGLSGGPSPPPSAPASYSSGVAFSNPRQIRGYQGPDEQYSAPNGSAAGFYSAARSYPYGSPLPMSGGGGHNIPNQMGDGQYACELATVDELGFNGARPAANAAGGGDNVLAMGWEGGVDVWRVGRGLVEQVGRIEGVKGAVKGAKILPNPPLNDPMAAHRPLICLTVHGPVAPQNQQERPPPIMMESESPYSTSPPSRPHTSTSSRSNENTLYDETSDWQTTVEIWSLSTRTRMAILFTSPLIPTSDIGFGRRGPPAPWGGLKVQVTGDKVVVGIGSSGELYIYKLDPGSKDARGEWKCAEKVWTSLQYPSPGSISSESGTSGVDARSNFGLPQIGTPVFSLSDRWLAYSPVSAGAFSAGGDINVPFHSPSVLAQAPPSQPAISAAVCVEDEALFNRVAREVTQEVIRGAKWAADAGYKKIASYWNGAPQNGSPPMQSAMSPGFGPAGMSHSPPQPSGLGQQLRQMQQYGGNVQAPPSYASEPRLVSLLDIGKISGTQQQQTPPMATFVPPTGVSHLSFAPGGLALLTASSKGDVIFIWDLMKVVHHPPSASHGHQRSASAHTAVQDMRNGASDETLGKHIRQIARFTRMTVATIIDVDWSSPRGDKIAVVTERGTVHFYDIPSSALQWPPPRRPPPASAGATQSTAVSNAVKVLNHSTQPLLTAARRRRSRSSSVGSPSGGFFNARRASGTVTASGQANQEPPAGDKIYLPHSPAGVQAGVIKYLTGKERGFIAVLGGGLLRIYALRSSAGVVSSNTWEYDLPALPDQRFTADDKKDGGFWSMRTRHWGSEETLDLDGGSGGGFWKSPLSAAEIETNSVFTPWQLERRVKVFIYRPEERKTTTITTFEEEEIPQEHHQHLMVPDSEPLPWEPTQTHFTAAELPPTPPTPTSAKPVPRAGKKSKRTRASAAPSPQPTTPDPSPPLPPAPPRKVRKEVKVTQAADEKWVFGQSISAERVFLREGRGDVEFVEGGEGEIREAMREGFFEDDVEVLELGQ